MATWPRHVALIVIISNNISLSPPIAIINHLVSDNSPFWYTKLHLSIIKNQPSYIELLRSALAIILFVGKRISYHLIFWEG